MSDDTHEQDQSPTVAEAGPATLARSQTGDDGSGVIEETKVVDAAGVTVGGASISRGPEPPPTQVGRFRIVRCIGTGGMGVVYAAHDDELDRDVAIKILRSDLAVGISGRERLLREAQAIAKLSHPNTVHVYEVGHDGERVFMAMELVPGPTLRQWCKEQERPWTAIVDAFLGAGEGLAAAHASAIVHRDFKPDNVIVANDGRPRVVDFGLARAHGGPSVDGEPTQDPDGDDEPEAPAPRSGSASGSDHGLLPMGLTATGIVVGTPAYMAPEQLARGEPDARTDQFAFCVSLHEMLYGKRPFAGSTYTALVKSIRRGTPVEVDPAARGVPKSVHAVVMRGLSPRPSDRFASMDELLGALRDTRAPKPRRWVGLAIATVATAGLLVTLDRPTAPPTDATAAPTADLVADRWAEIVAATDLPELVPTPLADDPTGVTVHRLKNGLTVYVAPQPLQPQVAVSLAVRAGSEEERGYAAGLGFLVMMSLYEGTEKIGVLDPERERPSRIMQQALLSSLGSIHDLDARDTILRAVAAAQEDTADAVLPEDLDDAAYALGGRGVTGFRGAGTTLGIQLPAHRVEAGLRILGEAVRAPVFRNMLGVVEHQLQRYKEITPGAHASQIIQRELTDATGLLEDYASATEYLMRFPLHDAQEFHATYYRPNNTAVVFVGDITVEEALEVSERVLGSWEPAPIPVRPPVDRPLREPVVRHEIEDGGAPAVYMAWPLPPAASADHAALEALADALNRHDGLASGLRSRVSDASWTITPQRALQVRAGALPDQTLAEAEAETIRALEDIAHDRLAQEAWDAALARAELTRAGWARRPTELADVITQSFIERGTWRDTATRLSRPPDRKSLVAAAAALLERDRIVVHKGTGPTWHLELPELPGARLPAQRGRQSAFVESIVDAPVTPPEPRFLVEGSHYERSRYGGGHLIASPLDGPLAFASWIVPVGVNTDPFLCDAMRARVRAAKIPGMDFGAYCTEDSVWVDVVAPAARFEAHAREVFEWLAHGEPTPDELKAHIERVLVWRADLRAHAEDRETGFFSWALRGEHGINAKLPSDEALERRGVQAMADALARARELPADVLYAGPHAQKVSGWLPPAVEGPRPPRSEYRVRDTDRDLVLVLDDPARETARVHAFLPWGRLGPRETLAAQIHDEAVRNGAEDGPKQLLPRWFLGPWWSPDPLATDAGFECAAEDVPLAVRTSVDLLRREVTPSELADARRRQEISFRAWRPELTRVPETVELWGGADTDPRVAQWLALPGLRPEDMRDFYELAAEHPVIVAIVADASRLDMHALGELGEVTRVTLADLDTLLKDDRLADGG